MPLIEYECYITYPDGHPAVGREQLIVLLGGNVGVPLFADKAGTTPLTNPVVTDEDGRAAFYAVPGAFVTELAGTLFHFLVTATEMDDAWPGVFVHEQTVASTTWTIAHNIGIQPLVTVLVDGQETAAGVSRSDDKTTVLTFGVPTSGTALLRR